MIMKDSRYLNFVSPFGTTNLMGIFGAALQLVLLLPIRTPCALAQDYGWTRTIGASSWDQTVRAATDSQGAVYLAGNFSNAPDFNSGEPSDVRTSAGIRDIFLSKYLASGTRVWTRTFGNEQTNSPDSVTVDHHDNVYIVGSFSGTMDLDATASVDLRTSTGGFSVGYISLYSTDGEYIRTNTLGGVTGSAFIKDLKILSDGDLAIYGRFLETVDFDMGDGVDLRQSNGSSDAFLGRYSPEGELRWLITFGSTEYEHVYDMAVDANDNLVVTGYFTLSFDSDPGEGTDIRTSAGGVDGFISRFSPTGERSWTKTIGGILNDYTVAVDVDTRGNIFVAGTFRDTVDFHTGDAFDLRTATGSFGDIFLIRFLPNGRSVWTNTIAGTGTKVVSPGALATENDEGVYLAGSYEGLIDFRNRGASVVKQSNGSRDAFIARYSIDSSYSWSISAGGTGSDNSAGVVFDRRNLNLFFHGDYSNSVDFDHTAGTDMRTYVGSSDVFLTKLSLSNWVSTVPTVTFPSNGLTTELRTPTISGSAAAESSVTIYDNGHFLGVVTANSEGGWTYTAQTNMPFGIHSFTATSTPSGGSESNESVAVYIVIVPGATGVPSAPQITNTPQVAVTAGNEFSVAGTSDPLATIVVYCNGIEVGIVAAGTNGQWTYNMCVDEIGQHTILAKVRNNNGTESIASAPIVVEVIADNNNHNQDSDHDGLSDTAEVDHGTDPYQADTDGDTILDGQEISDGSSAVDRGSHLPILGSILYGGWNGFLGLQNILEEHNTGDARVRMSTLIEYCASNKKGLISYNIGAGREVDSVMLSPGGFVANCHGLITSSIVTGSGGTVDGRMTYYKPKGAGDFEFAYSLPLTSGDTGRQYVQYNTNQPSTRITDTKNFVANWVVVANDENRKRKGTLVVYGVDGTSLRTTPLTLPPSGRLHISLHQYGAGKVGLVEWIPQDGRAKTHLNSVRYFYDNSTLRDTFTSAVALSGNTGSGQLLAAPFDTQTSQAILELSNVTDTKISLTLTFYGATANQKVTQKVKLAAHATQHIAVSKVLNNLKGFVTVKGNKPSSVLASMLQYARHLDGGLLNVSAEQAGEALGAKLHGSYNTFLGQDCVLELLNPGGSTVSVEIAPGSDLSSFTKETIELKAGSRKDYALCSKVAKNSYGMVVVSPSRPNSIVGSVLRIGLNNRYRFSTVVR